MGYKDNIISLGGLKREKNKKEKQLTIELRVGDNLIHTYFINCIIHY